ncbi:hypothetical protein [Mesorhizobium sp. NPDC059025]|uniref:hypothetical protein n=1 Tax=unclassified Mesorhizobium TaxID=325217 RepID=UPI00366D959E
MTVVELHEPLLHALPNDIFSYPAESFVEAWAAALDLTENELPMADRLDLANAIRKGTSRLRIIDALGARTATVPAKLYRNTAMHVLTRKPDQFSVIESFTQFAPENDAAFLQYIFTQICDRDPSAGERLSLEFDLRRGVATRSEVVKRVVASAHRDGTTVLWDTLQPTREIEKAQSADPTDARIMPAGLVVDKNGQETLVFVREVENVGWMIGPDLLRQPLSISDNGWNVYPGWLIVGPKRSFTEGLWLLSLDLVQEKNAEIDVEIVANSGLDILQSLTIVGSFSGTVCVGIEHEHRFIELRIRVHERNSKSRWLRPRNIAMQRAS